MRRPLPRLATLLAVAALGAACSGGDTTTPSSDAAPTAAEAPAATAASGAVDAEIKDFVFVPADLEVAVGTTVTWTNRDRFGHTVTSGPPGEPTGAFDLVLGLTNDADTTGMTASHTFDEAGTFEFFCRYHPSMVGTITVTG